MRINKGVALSMGLLAFIELGIAQKPMFPLLPGYENSIIFKSAVSQYSISSLHSLYILPFIQGSKDEQQNISGWKKVGVVSAEFIVSEALTIIPTFIFAVLPLAPLNEKYPTREELAEILPHYILTTSLVSATTVWGIGSLFGDRRSYLKGLLGGFVGSLIGGICLYEVFWSGRSYRRLFDLGPFHSYGDYFGHVPFWAPALGATIGYNL